MRNETFEPSYWADTQEWDYEQGAFLLNQALHKLPRGGFVLVQHEDWESTAVYFLLQYWGRSLQDQGKNLAFEDQPVPQQLFIQQPKDITLFPTGAEWLDWIDRQLPTGAIAVVPVHPSQVEQLQLQRFYEVVHLDSFVLHPDKAQHLWCEQQLKLQEQYLHNQEAKGLLEKVLALNSLGMAVPKYLLTLREQTQLGNCACFKTAPYKQKKGWIMTGISSFVAKQLWLYETEDKKRQEIIGKLLTKLRSPHVEWFVAKLPQLNCCEAGLAWLEQNKRGLEQGDFQLGILWMMLFEIYHKYGLALEQINQLLEMDLPQRVKLVLVESAGRIFSLWAENQSRERTQIAQQLLNWMKRYGVTFHELPLLGVTLLSELMQKFGPENLIFPKIRPLIIPIMGQSALGQGRLAAALCSGQKTAANHLKKEDLVRLRRLMSKENQGHRQFVWAGLESYFYLNKKNDLEQYCQKQRKLCSV